MNSEKSTHGCLQPTATVSAALIGLVGVLVTAFVSYRVGSRTSANEVEDLLTSKDGKIAELQRTIDERDATIRELRAARSRPPVDTPSKPDINDQTPEPIPPTTVREAPGLRVELLLCRLAGDELKCEFKATSTDRDKTVYLRRARLIESNNSEIWPIRMQFASSVSEGDHRPGTGQQVYAQMVRGISIGGNVVFAGVEPASAHVIPLIELAFDGLDAQFRNIQPE